MAEFDFTNFNDSGFTVVEAGRYAAKTTGWKYRVKENGNQVFYIDIEINGGDYDGETMRYFHTVTDNKKSKGFFLRLLRELSIIKDGDRERGGKEKNLHVKADYGDKDDNGYVEIPTITVNGEKRKVAGLKTTAVVINKPNNETGDTEHWVDRLETAGSTASGVKSSNFPV